MCRKRLVDPEGPIPAPLQTIKSEIKAAEIIALVGREGPLLEAVRKLRQTGDRNGFNQVNPETHDEKMRAKKLSRMLFDK